MIAAATSGISNYSAEESKTLVASLTSPSTSISSSSGFDSSRSTDSFSQKSSITSLLSNINNSTNNNSVSLLSIENEIESQDTGSNADESEGAPPREVGHNLYILAHKLAKFNKELSVLLKSRECLEDEALAYYAVHTAQIEVYYFLCFCFILKIQFFS